MADRKETQEMIESFQNDRTPKFDPKMFDQPESMGGDKKPKAVRPKAQPNQKREGEKPIAKPGKKPIAERLFDAPVESILEESTRKAIGKKSGGFMSCPHRPDGVRGVGAAIKGTKFSGLK